MKRSSIDAVLSADSVLPMVKLGEEVEVSGWVRTIRQSKNVAFIVIYDGSTFSSLQAVVDKSLDIGLSGISSGASLRLSGKLVESKGSGQSIDFEVSDLEVLGESSEDYPIQPKRHTMDFFREHPHLRMRTQLFQAIFRIRHRLAFSVHDYFDRAKFIHVHTPIISGSDCEGAGEMFSVNAGDKGYFFDKPAGLTVSGQLEAETASMGLGRVYTFGPTFRAENSNTSRHLSEFWMIEPEIAFADLGYSYSLAEGLLKYCITCLLDECPDELEYIQGYIEEEEKNMKKEDRSQPLVEKLESVISEPFAVVSYTEALDILKKSKPAKKGKFEFPVEDWGMDLQSEHERYLVEKHFKKPVVVTDYPKGIKAFYMRDNDDGKTVAAMDILFPGIGEIVGGSQREERIDVLKEKMSTFDVSEEEMSWYLDTRRFGTAPHSGFGIGFDRFVQFCTGMKNIRDVVLYPRTPGKI